MVDKKKRKEKSATIESNLEESGEDINGTGRSNSPHNSSPDIEVGEETQKKKTRGPAKLKAPINGKDKRIEIVFNDIGQPIEDESVQLSTYLGCLARELVPLTQDNWLKLPKDIEDDLWKCVQLKYIIDECNTPMVLRMMGRLWRNNKSSLPIEIRNAGKGLNAKRKIDLLKPEYTDMKQWEMFVKERQSSAFIEKSNKFREMRAKQDLPHTMSRKGYARLEDEMKKQSTTPSAVSRVDIWTRGHLSKDGKPINEAVNEKLKQIEECPPAAKNTDCLKDDAIAIILGAERRGQVRGLGFGATPSKLALQVQKGRIMAKLHDKVHNLEQELRDFKTIFFQGRQNQQSQSGGAEDIMHPRVATPQSHQGSTGVQGSNNLENAKCKLLHWSGTGEVVAEGRIASIDPQSRVHHTIFGPACWKVWVDQVKVENVALIRPTDEMAILEDAIGSTTAWSIPFINLDD